jgi:protein required for attachment to host cells
MRTWILIADASRARIVEVEDDQRLRLVREVSYPKGRARAQELVSDEPGRMVKGRGRQVLSAMDSRTSPHEVEAGHFAAQLAHLLHDGRVHKKYDSLALVAPPHFLGLLREELDPETAKMVVSAVHRDYTHAPEHELHHHLGDTLAEISKAAHLR